jgi:uncharacterized membrane protein
MLIDFFKGTWLKHPLHPMLVHLPAGLWPAALIFDLLSQAHFGGNAIVRLSFFCIVLGLIATALAIPAGLADWAGIKKENPAWKLGLYHMALNLLATVIYAINFGLRFQTFKTATHVEMLPLILSVIGVALLFPSAYLGGRMVSDYGISVARMSKGKWRKIAERGNANLPPQKEKKS